MRFTESPLRGAWIIAIEPHVDARGFFTRLWCSREAAEHDLPPHFVQSSLSRSHRRGTLRGLHMQLPPSREGKLVQCMRGRIWDVAVDLRVDSPTYLQHFGVELTADAHNAFYIPPGMLHGFQTLEDDTEVFYQMTDFYAPELACGARWNDPAFGISWPLGEPTVIAERDAGYPDFDRAAYERAVRSATTPRQAS